MINILLKGVDEFLGSHIEKALSPSLAKIYGITTDEIVFTCLHSIIYHEGIDQTSYHMIITVEANTKYKDKEVEAADYLLKVSKAFAVHAHVYFTYLNGNEYKRIDKDYPLFVTSKEEESLEENLDEEIYDGNIFEEIDTTSFFTDEK